MRTIFKKLTLLLFVFLPLKVRAIGVSVFPVGNQTTTYVIDASIAPGNDIVALPSGANNARVQMPTRTVNACTLQAMAGNTGSIYVGGNLVTNSIGVKEGMKLAPGEAFGPVTTTNSNLLYVATDTGGNKVKIFCN